MRFTENQYNQAIGALKDAREQLVPDGNSCSCCGDSGHQAFECGHNPLVAMVICISISKQAEALHETLHMLSGHVTYMGEMVGPAKVVLPETTT